MINWFQRVYSVGVLGLADFQYKVVELSGWLIIFVLSGLYIVVSLVIQLTNTPCYKRLFIEKKPTKQKML